MRTTLFLAPVVVLMAFCAMVWWGSGPGDPHAPPRHAAVADAPPNQATVIFLHHSTGECVWNGGVVDWFAAYNKAHKSEFSITERAFPGDAPYGWNNYPFDYWNIWVSHAGPKAFKGEPTLEMLTKSHSVIVFKHCFPVSAVEEDTGKADVAGEDKRAENYKLQYEALKKKMRSFPATKFIVWTGPALIQAETDDATAKRAQAFFDWVVKTWDEPGDNIYLWDFRALETEGGLYLKGAYALDDSHPNEAFSRKVAPLFCQRVLDVIHGQGDRRDRTGKSAPAGPLPKDGPSKTPPAKSTASR